MGLVGGNRACMILFLGLCETHIWETKPDAGHHDITPIHLIHHVHSIWTSVTSFYGNRVSHNAPKSPDGGAHLLN